MLLKLLKASVSLMHRWSHLLERFCPELELCTIACKKLVQQKLLQD